ncbi:MAG: CpaF family protein [Exilibacterium sp.]
MKTESREPANSAAALQSEAGSRQRNEQELEFKNQIHERLLKVIDLTRLNQLEETEARRQVQAICQQLIEESSLPINILARKRIVKQIEDEVMGLGPLESLLADDSVADILVNGPDAVYVERNGKLELTSVHFVDENHLRNIIDRIVSSVGRRIDESSPMVDARLKDGSRVNVIIPPLAIDGPMMSIRRFTVTRLNMENLVRKGSLPPAAAELLEGVVKGRLNTIVSGGTGSGKTTMLNILSGYIPEDERIVTIEDSAELQMQQPHVVRLETRPPNIENKGEVTQRDLVKNTLRMRPERIVLGEVRGGEAFDMLQAMNTGHDGSLTTIHANSPRDALTRIQNMVSMAGLDLPVCTVLQQIASAVDVVVHVQRQEDGRRRLVSIQEINGMEGDVITMSELLSFKRRGHDKDGNVLGAFAATGIVPGFYDQLKQRGIELPLELFNPDYEWSADYE